MTLTSEQQEEIVRLRAKSTKLNDELENIVIPNVVLTPTKKQEIANINAEIVSYIDHAGITREKYISIVQPLKYKRTNLILQNKVIYQENDILKQASQQQHESDRAAIQQQIDNNEDELLNAIKNTDLKEAQKA